MNKQSMRLTESTQTNVPCKDCSKRYVGCHSKCEAYLTFKKQLEEQNKKVKRQIYIQLIGRPHITKRRK